MTHSLADDEFVCEQDPHVSQKNQPVAFVGPVSHVGPNLTASRPLPGDFRPEGVVGCHAFVPLRPDRSRSKSNFNDIGGLNYVFSDRENP
jgi:hypothetical protein